MCVCMCVCVYVCVCVCLDVISHPRSITHARPAEISLQAILATHFHIDRNRRSYGLKQTWPVRKGSAFSDDSFLSSPSQQRLGTRLEIEEDNNDIADPEGIGSDSRDHSHAYRPSDDDTPIPRVPQNRQKTSIPFALPSARSGGSFPF